MINGLDRALEKVKELIYEDIPQSRITIYNMPTKHKLAENTVFIHVDIEFYDKGINKMWRHTDYIHGELCRDEEAIKGFAAYIVECFRTRGKLC